MSRIEKIFKELCEKGDADGIIKMVDKISEFVDMNELCNVGLKAACLRGHRHIVELMIKLGATNVNLGLYDACVFGSDELVEDLIRLGANCFDEGLLGACRGGRLKIAELMIQYGARNFEHAYEVAFHSGREKLMKLMYKKSAFFKIPIRYGIVTLVQYEHYTLIKMLLTEDLKETDSRLIIPKNANEWRYIILNLEKKLLTRLLCLVPKSKREETNKLIDDQADIYNPKYPYLINRHCLGGEIVLRMAKDDENTIMYNVGCRFMCKDILTFNARFIGFHH